MKAFLIILGVFLAVFLCCALIIVGFIGFVVLNARQDYHTELKAQKPFEATVVADLISMLIVRDEKGELYSLRRPLNGNFDVDTTVKVKRIYGDLPEIEGPQTLKIEVYRISAKKEAKRARVVRRLNKEFALCELGKAFVFVRCSADEQFEAQEPPLRLPVEVDAEKPSFIGCVRV